MTFRIDRKASPRGIEMSVLTNAGENVENLTPELGGMLHAVRREERETKMLREIDQLAIEAFFAPNEMALDLDIDAIAPKCGEE
jgi:hypothetical protein